MTEQKEQLIVLQAQLADVQKVIKAQAERIADLQMLSAAKLGLEKMPATEPLTESGTTLSPKPSTVSDETPKAGRYSVLN